MGRPVRWRVVIVDDHERSRARLRAAIRDAGGDVAGEAVRRADAAALVVANQPDVAVVSVGLPDGDGLDAAHEIAAVSPCAVVLLTSHRGDEITRRAVDAGVMAWLAKPLRPAELAPALDLAIARFRELARLRRTLEERKVIERAKGLLMMRLGVAEDEVFRRLRRTAMDTRRPLVEVARAVLLSEMSATTPPHVGQQTRLAHPGRLGYTPGDSMIPPMLDQRCST
jgi:response regulator NasT